MNHIPVYTAALGRGSSQGGDRRRNNLKESYLPTYSQRRNVSDAHHHCARARCRSPPARSQAVFIGSELARAGDLTSRSRLVGVSTDPVR
eukprot:6172940-Pleurochrysis_carterae.AAC.1